MAGTPYYAGLHTASPSHLIGCAAQPAPRGGDEGGGGTACAGGFATAPGKAGPGDPTERAEGPAARRKGWPRGDGLGRPPANWLPLFPDSAAATPLRQTPLVQRTYTPTQPPKSTIPPWTRAQVRGCKDEQVNLTTYPTHVGG